MHLFTDRRAAGRELALALERLPIRAPAMVLGLPRGGVPVAEEVARVLHTALDVIVVRKIGLPAQPELAIGAIAAGGIVVQEPRTLPFAAISSSEFEELLQRERLELARREQLYRRGKGPLRLAGTTAVLIDDGIATGATMIAATAAARAANADSIIVAAPVASSEAARRLSGKADELVILQTPAMFFAVGEWYEQFAQTTDEEVLACLRRAASRQQGNP